MPLTPQLRAELIQTYRDGLLEDTVPFWIRHTVDRECGGFQNCVARDGTRLSTDRPMWIHSRFTWLLATLYDQVEPRPEWRELAAHGIDYLDRYGFDADGRMFFLLTRDGKPLRKRRYVFTEAFGVIAYAAYAKITGDRRAAEKAAALFELIIRLLTTPGLLEPKVCPETRQSKGLAVPMILIAIAQVLREAAEPALCDEWIDRCIAEIERDFMKEEFRAVLECVGPNGEFIDNFDGRLLCPGHAIEAAWFILHEAKHRGNDPRLIALGCRILDWMWDWGWDGEFGGIIYYRDVRNLPPTEYWHDMKFWWPQNETIIATLLAYSLTGEERYLAMHAQAHAWAYRHFPDPEHGEWFGYLRRDGAVSTTLKGNHWKGPFHLPRMQLYCWKLLEEMPA